MQKATAIGISVLALGALPLAARAEDKEVGFHGGTTRLDNGYYGTWVESAQVDYAVCGGDTPFVSGISVNAKGLWNNSVLCSSYDGESRLLTSYVAKPQANDGLFPPTNNDGRGQINDTIAVANCGEDGFVIGVAQPSGDLVAPSGTPVLCGTLPAPSSDCRIIQTGAGSYDHVRDAWEVDATDWTEYPSITCGPGRFAQAVAFRRYAAAEFDSQILSYAMGGLVCCSIEDALTGPREKRWDPGSP